MNQINLDELFTGDPNKLIAYVKATENLNSAIDALIKISKAGNGELTRIKETFESSNKSVATQNEQIQQMVKEFAKLNQANKDFEKVKSAANKTQKTTNQLNEAEIRLKVEQQQQLAEVKRAIRAEIKERDAQAGSLNKLRAQLVLAKREFDKLNLSTDEGKNKSEALRKTINKLDGEIRELESSTGRMQRNVGNYTDSIKEALQETGLFGNAINGVSGGFGSATKGLKSMTLGFKGLKAAIAATGIGLLLVALGSLATLLTQTKEGTDFVERAMAGLQATINVIIDRMKIFARGVKELFAGNFSKAADAFANSIDGITTEIVEETKAIVQLKKELQDLEKRELALISAKAKLTAEFEKQQNIRDEETRSLEERIAANEKAGEIALKLFKLEQGLAAERLRIIKQQNATRDSLTTAQIEAEQTALAKLYEVREDYETRRSQLISDTNQLIRDRETKKIEDEIATQKAGIERSLRQAEEGSMEELKLKEQLLKLEFEEEKRINALLAAEDQFTKGETLLREEELLTDLKELRDEFRNKEAEAQATEAERLKQETDARIRKQKELNDAIKAEADALKAKQTALKEDIKNTLLAADAEDNLANTVLGNVRDFLKAKLAEFIANQLAKAQIAPPASLFVLPLIGAGLSALFNKLIPQFEKGTNFSPEGAAIVGEKGFEIAEKGSKKWVVGAKGEEMTYLERGTKIYPHEQSVSLLDQINASANVGAMMKGISMDSKTLAAPKNKPLKVDEAGIKRAIKEGVKEQVQHITNFDANGVSKFIKNKGYKTEILNKKNGL